MALSLSENFNNGLGTLTVLQGTWDGTLGYARATVIPPEPEAIGIFKPGDTNYLYNSAASDPPGSYAQFKVAAQMSPVGGSGVWMLSGGLDLSKPAIAVTTRPAGARTRYWTGSALIDPPGFPDWQGTVQVGDLFRVEIIGNECRVGLNGALKLAFQDALLMISGYHGVRIPHDSANSGIDDWRMGPLSQFTLT